MRRFNLARLSIPSIRVIRVIRRQLPSVFLFPLPCSSSKNTPSASATALPIRPKPNCAPASSPKEAGADVVARLEQVESRAHLHRLRAGVGAGRRAGGGRGARAGRTAGTSMPTTSGWRRSTASFRTRIFSRSMSRIPSASPPRPRRSRSFVERAPGAGRRGSRFRGSIALSKSRAPRSSASPASTCSRCRTREEFTATSQQQKGAGNFIAEVSMDETDTPQTPPELLVILAALAAEKIPAQTIAPKFTGRFNKGRRLRRRPRAVRAGVSRRSRGHRLRHRALRAAGESQAQRPLRQRQVFALPDHPAHAAEVRRGPAHQDRGHDLAGGAHRPGRGRRRGARLCQGNLRRGARRTSTSSAGRTPSVIDIDRAKLPTRGGSGRLDAASNSPARCGTTRSNPLFNPSLRQLLHVAFKLAAKKGQHYLDLLKKHEEIVGRNVTENLFERHLRPLFLGA